LAEHKGKLLIRSKASMYLQYIAQCYIREQTPREDHTHFFHNMLYSHVRRVTQETEMRGKRNPAE